VGSDIAIARDRSLPRRVFHSDPFTEDREHEVHLVETDRRLARFELDNEPLPDASQLSELLLGQARADSASPNE